MQLQLKCQIPQLEHLQTAHAHPHLIELVKNQVHSDEKPFLKQFTATVFGQILHVWYELHVVVRYDAWNDLRKRLFVRFPISISSTNPESASVFKSKEQFGGQSSCFGGEEVLQQSFSCSSGTQSAGSVGGDVVDRYTMGVMMSPSEISNLMDQSSEQFAEEPERADGEEVKQDEEDEEKEHDEADEAIIQEESKEEEVLFSSLLQSPRNAINAGVGRFE